MWRDGYPKRRRVTGVGYIPDVYAVRPSCLPHGAPALVIPVKSFDSRHNSEKLAVISKQWVTLPYGAKYVAMALLFKFA